MILYWSAILCLSAFLSASDATSSLTSLSVASFKSLSKTTLSHAWELRFNDEHPQEHLFADTSELLTTFSRTSSGQLEFCSRRPVCKKLRRLVETDHTLFLEVDGLPSWYIPENNHPIGFGIPLGFIKDQKLYVNTRLMVSSWTYGNHTVRVGTKVTKSSLCKTNMCFSFDFTFFHGTLEAYEHRWNGIESVYGDETHLFQFMLAIGTVLLLIAGGVGLLVSKWLQHDVNIMGSQAVIQEFGFPENTITWKRLAGDVFRSPRYPTLYLTCVANGCSVLAFVAMLPFGLWWYSFVTPSALLLVSGTSLFVSGVVHASTLHYFSAIVPKRKRTKWKILSYLSWPAICISWNAFVYADRVPSEIVNYTLVDDAAANLALFLFAESALGILSGVLVWSRVSKKCKYAPGKTNKLPINIQTETPIGEILYYMVIPVAINAPTLILHGYTLFNYLLIGVHYDKLFGLSLVTLALGVVAVAMCNIAFRYSSLHRGHHRWWSSILLNVPVAGVFVLHGLLASNTTPTMLLIPFVFSVGICSALAYGAVGFLSNYCFVTYIYKHLKFS